MPPNVNQSVFCGLLSDVQIKACQGGGEFFLSKNWAANAFDGVNNWVDAGLSLQSRPTPFSGATPVTLLSFEGLNWGSLLSALFICWRSQPPIDTPIWGFVNCRSCFREYAGDYLTSMNHKLVFLKRHQEGLRRSKDDQTRCGFPLFHGIHGESNQQMPGLWIPELHRTGTASVLNCALLWDWEHGCGAWKE